MNFKIILINIILCIEMITSKNQKGQGRFERKFKECQGSTTCSARTNDEDCIYKCINKECYEEMIEKNEYLLEFGEINPDFKKAFDKCYIYKLNEGKIRK